MFFSKYHSLGNDFIFIDDREKKFPIIENSLIFRLCSRHLGIGADGLVLLQHSKKNDFRMRIFNSDGMEAACCGNALICMMQYIIDLGFVPKEYFLETMRAEISARIDMENNVSLSMPMPTIIKSNIVIDKRAYTWVDSGVFHAISFVEDIKNIDVNVEGKKVRNHKAFLPTGVNVDFVFLDKEDKVYVRTYEKGVESETLSCGTAALATAFLICNQHPLKNPVKIFFSEGCLEIAFDDKKKKNKTCTMKGKATFVFTGSITL